MIYTELASQPEPTIIDRPHSSLSNRLSPESEDDDDESELANSLSKLKIQYNQDNGYFQINQQAAAKNPAPNQHTFKLTVTIAFARNLVKLVAREENSTSSSQFFFAYKLFGNQITTKPFGDIVSAQINSESTSVRLRSSLADLTRFLAQQPPLEVILTLYYYSSLNLNTC